MADKSSIAALAISVISLCTAGVSIGVAAKNADRPSQPAETRPAETTSAPKAENDGTTQYVMYVGTNDKDTYKPEHSREEAMDIVDRICLSYFDGYTLQEATGSWKDEKDNITHEYTIVCYFDGAEKEAVYHAADDIIAALNQNTVLIEESSIKIDYYSSANK